MTRKLHGITLLLGLALLAGCASSGVNAPTPGQEALIWSSEAQRPGWTMMEPEGVEDGLLTFVGTSLRHATEQGAREDARRNVTSAVVKYMGTLVKDKFEKASVSYGLDSSVIDPTSSARQFEKQLATNLDGQVKPKNWYAEKWQTPTGIGYQYFVEAKVPANALGDEFKKLAKQQARDAEKKAKEAADATAKAQAEKASEFWKKMQEENLVE
ncbi:MAG: hypothetical protein C0624_00535 [Desulfuromonas sp.]|nr:MAG: hypothetical protein C0624_00535 [Desulfuromonas sp.]